MFRYHSNEFKMSKKIHQHVCQTIKHKPSHNKHKYRIKYFLFQKLEMLQSAYCDGELPGTIELIGGEFCRTGFKQLSSHGRQKLEKLQAEAVFNNVNLDTFSEEWRNGTVTLEPSSEPTTSLTIMPSISPIIDFQPLLSMLGKALMNIISPTLKPEERIEEEKTLRDHIKQEQAEKSTATAELSTSLPSLTSQLYSRESVTRGTTGIPNTFDALGVQNETDVHPTVESLNTVLTSTNVQERTTTKSTDDLPMTLETVNIPNSTSVLVNHEFAKQNISITRNKNEGTVLVVILVPLTSIIIAWCGVWYWWHSKKQGRARTVEEVRSVGSKRKIFKGY
jgi:hypothetical protein